MRRIPAVAISFAALASVAIPSSAAGVMSLGQLAPGSPPAPNCQFGARTQTEWQQQVASGTSYTAPSSGVITSWSTNASVGDGQIYGLKILRPLTHGRYGIVAHDGPRTLTPGQVNTFKTFIPVRAGDVLGYHYNPSLNQNTACAFRTGDRGDVSVTRQGPDRDTVPDPPDGFVVEFVFVSNEFRLNLSATFLPAPTIASVAPASGLAAGGSDVVITGSNFTEVKDVSFGGVAAKSFTVDSETRISAVAPPHTAPSEVPLTVTTFAGTAKSTFAYTTVEDTTTTPVSQCVVPRLGHVRLKAAREKLTKAMCKLGKVKLAHGARRKTGSVSKQRPKAGTVLPAGGEVSVVVSPSKKRR